mmetsp:Transcript_65255/g.181431  ORF Transcript_65255/g.181431 Transcript_65255/m.181431 type:complete len:210 (-) Transcript_65255:40-669(-)
MQPSAFVCISASGKHGARTTRPSGSTGCVHCMPPSKRNWSGSIGCVHCMPAPKRNWAEPPGALPAEAYITGDPCDGCLIGGAEGDATQNGIGGAAAECIGDCTSSCVGGAEGDGAGGAGDDAPRNGIGGAVGAAPSNGIGGSEGDSLGGAAGDAPKKGIGGAEDDATSNGFRPRAAWPAPLMLRPPGKTKPLSCPCTNIGGFPLQPLQA